MVKRKRDKRVWRYQRAHIFRKSKDRQRNRQRKQNNNDLQSITHKTKDRVIRTPLKIGVNPGASEGKLVSAVLFFYFTQYITAMNSILPRQNTVKSTS